MNFQPPEYDDPRDDEDRMNDGSRAALADKIGFSIAERGGSPVIVEDGETKPADLEHRVLWDEVVSLTAECDSLRAVNAELLEALEAYEAWADKTICTDVDLKRIREQIRAAIASARKQKGEE